MGSEDRHDVLCLSSRTQHNIYVSSSALLGSDNSLPICVRSGHGTTKPPSQLHHIHMDELYPEKVQSLCPGVIPRSLYEASNSSAPVISVLLMIGMSLMGRESGAHGSEADNSSELVRQKQRHTL